MLHSMAQLLPNDHESPGFCFGPNTSSVAAVCVNDHVSLCCGGNSEGFMQGEKPK